MIDRAGNRPGLVLGLILLAGASLAGCGRNDDGEAPGPDLFADRSEKGQEGFGDTFEKASRASPESEPINVGEDDLPPVSTTTEPVIVD